MIDRTALPESALAHLIRSHYSKYETAQPLNRSTAQPLNRSTIMPRDDASTPNWIAGPDPELSGQDHRCFIYAVHDVRRLYDLLPVD
jgi:hypothetical protein